jgi:hypothetical protein
MPDHWLQIAKIVWGFRTEKDSKFVTYLATVVIKRFSHELNIRRGIRWDFTVSVDAPTDGGVLATRFKKHFEPARPPPKVVDKNDDRFHSLS